MNQINQQTILVVDDIAANIEVLRNILKTDYKVIAATNGELALQIAHGEHRPDMILLDIMMQGMDGYEVCQRLKSDTTTKKIPVIFVTAKGEIKDEKRGFELGAVDYITKPVSPSIVLARVCTHFTLHNQSRELARLNEEKNQFLGMAAHDLRNPLGALMGYTELLMEDNAGEINEKQKGYLQKIAVSCQSMRGLIDDLLDVSKIESGVVELNLSKTDIGSLVNRILSMFESKAESKDILIRCTIDNSVPDSISLDMGKIEQVISNLVSNAIKYSHSGKQVDIHVFQEELNLVVEVKDQGQGIPQSELEVIYNPFQKTSIRTTAGEDSTGLGLAIVHRLVNGHGGEIKVSSEVGIGTTFQVVLPIKNIE